MKLLKFIISIITIFSVMGCSYKDSDRSKNLTERVDQLWQYIKIAQYQKAWENCSQRFRNDIKKEEFVRDMRALFSEEGTRIVGVGIRTIKFEKNNYASVQIEISYADNEHAIYDDTWIFENGDWMFDRGGLIVGANMK